MWPVPGINVCPHREWQRWLKCGTIEIGISQRKRIVPAKAPRSCATMKPGASTGRIPANVFVNARANATAGLAKDVRAVGSPP